MKNFLQNLLIVLALCLCALCVRQWYFQTVQRNLLAERNQKIFDRYTAIQGYTNSIQTLDRQVAQFDRQVSQLNQSLVTNSDLIITQKRELARLRAENDTLANAIAQYSNNIILLTNRLAGAYAMLEKQNGILTNLASQRDEFVKKYNDSVSNYNLLGSNYNGVVDRLNKLQK